MSLGKNAKMRNGRKKEKAPVRSRVLVDEAQGVHQLVNRRHNAVVETAAGKEKGSSLIKFPLLPVQTEFLLAPDPAKSTFAHPGSVPDYNEVFPGIS